MDIFKEVDLKEIDKKRLKIESLELKQMEKNLLLIGLFDSYFVKLFNTFESNVEKHLMYIKAKTGIEFSRVKYLHYLNQNHKSLYDKYILLSVKKDQYSIGEKADSIKYYSNKDAKKSNTIDEEYETKSLLACLDIKKKYMIADKDLRLYKNLNFVNGLAIFFLLVLVLYLV